MAALAAGSIVMSVAALPQASADNLKHKRHQVQRRINSASQDLDASSAQLRNATAALQQAQAQLDQAQSQLATAQGRLSAAEVLDRQMQAKLEAAVARLAEARAALAQGRQRIAAQREELGRIVAQNYQDGDPSLMGLSMVLTSQDPAQLTGQLNSVQNVMDKESAVLDRMEAAKVLLTVHQRQVAAAKAEVAQQRRDAAANLARKRVLEAQARDAEAQVQTLVGRRADARRAAAKAKAADLAVLTGLERERDRISAILKRRAEEARRRAARSGASYATGSIGSGFLGWPVVGPVTSPFGWRVHPIYGYWSLHDGIDIAAGCGVPIHAPASGRVMSEYWETAWGNRLIIDHGWRDGAGWATIVNHLSGYAVGPGARVYRGEVVGYIGTTGWSTGCHTHFTVMRNGVPVNPMNYL
jgi:murein DD-endopeptidase MepM/ murein hydrolase activator NlpD